MSVQGGKDGFYVFFKNQKKTLKRWSDFFVFMVFFRYWLFFV